MPNSDYVYTLVGKMSVPRPGRYEVVEQRQAAVNEALSKLPFTASVVLADHVAPGEEAFVMQQAEAEEMLLDWLSDAEIGEVQYSVLYGIDRLRAMLREHINDGPHMQQAFADIQQTRVQQARFVKWIHNAAVLRGRPPLGSIELAALEDDGDTLNS